MPNRRSNRFSGKYRFVGTPEFKKALKAGAMSGVVGAGIGGAASYFSKAIQRNEVLKQQEKLVLARKREVQKTREMQEAELKPVVERLGNELNSVLEKHGYTSAYKVNVEGNENSVKFRIDFTPKLQEENPSLKSDLYELTEKYAVQFRSLGQRHAAEAKRLSQKSRTVAPPPATAKDFGRGVVPGIEFGVMGGLLAYITIHFGRRAIRGVASGARKIKVLVRRQLHRASGAFKSYRARRAARAALKQAARMTNQSKLDSAGQLPPQKIVRQVEGAQPAPLPRETAVREEIRLQKAIDRLSQEEGVREEKKVREIFAEAQRRKIQSSETGFLRKLVQEKVGRPLATANAVVGREAGASVRLNPISTGDLERLVGKLGYAQESGRGGGHRHYIGPSGKRIQLPHHGSQEISVPLLHQIIRELGVTAEEFENLRHGKSK